MMFAEQDLRQAFALYPSGVAIVTVLDRDGAPQGFTASSFVPLSMDPPMVLVCLNRAAQCHDAFVSGETFAISLLRPGHEPLARRFAARGADKFGAGGLVFPLVGPPIVEGALASFSCRIAGRYPGGDHVILTAAVLAVRHDPGGAAMVHVNREFRVLEL